MVNHGKYHGKYHGIPYGIPLYTMEYHGIFSQGYIPWNDMVYNGISLVLPGKL